MSIVDVNHSSRAQAAAAFAAALRGEDVDLSEPAPRPDSPPPPNPYDQQGGTEDPDPDATDAPDPLAPQKTANDDGTFPPEPIIPSPGEPGQQQPVGPDEGGVPPTPQTPVTEAPGGSDTPASTTDSSQPPSQPWANLDDDQRRAAYEIFDWARSLPPEALQSINALLSGQYVLTPKNATTAGTPTTAADVPAPQPVSYFDDDEFEDPKAAERIRALQSEMEELRTAQQEQIQRRQQDERNQFLNVVTTVGDDFAKTYSLDDGTLDSIMQQAASLGILQATMAAHPGDHAAAVRDALDQAAWTMPAFRDARIKEQAAAQAAQQQQDAVEAAKRKARAGVASSSGGSVPRVEPTTTPKTRQDKEKAIAADIAAAWSNR